VSLKHPGGGEVAVQTSMRVALNELLQDLGAEGDDSVTVTLVPVEGRVVRIGGLKIVYMTE
jgi:polyphenol oxidase